MDEEISEGNIKIENMDGIQFRCQNCGSEMVYNPETETLHCDTCDTTKEIEVEDFEIIENNFELALEKLEQSKVHITKESVINEVECKGCGARSIYNGKVFSDKCVYCGSAYVVLVEEGDYIKPEYVVPFKIDKKIADRKIGTWAKSKFYMNSDFKKTLRTDGMYGVYISYWTFDTNTVTPYSAKKGEHYYVKVNKSMQQRTRWKNVRGTHSEFLDDVLVPAVSDKIPNITEQSGRFDTTLAVPYDEQYISGFLAMKYDIELEAAWEIGKEICKERIQLHIKEEIGGDEVASLKMAPNLNDITFKHVILPLWLNGFTYKDKVYTFIVNGQNGSVTGKYPLDVLRVVLSICALILWCIAIWLLTY